MSQMVYLLCHKVKPRWMQFDEIYRQNYTLVYSLTNKIVQDEEVSKDITQEIFLKLYHVLRDSVKILNVQGWLYRCTVNYCYNYLRDIRKKKPTVNIDAAAEINAPEINWVELEKVQRIQQMVLQLKEKEQLLLTLYSEGMSYKEMADVSGIPFNSIGKSLMRALSKLKKKCHEE